MATCGCDILYLYNDRAGDCIYLYIFSRIYLYIFSRNTILVHEIQYMTEIMYKITDRIFRTLHLQVFAIKACNEYKYFLLMCKTADFCHFFFKIILALQLVA